MNWKIVLGLPIAVLLVFVFIHDPRFLALLIVAPIVFAKRRVKAISREEHAYAKEPSIEEVEKQTSLYHSTSENTFEIKDK